MDNQIEIRCPCCGVKIYLEMKDGKLFVDNSNHIEVSEIPEKLNIEFG